MSAMTVLDRAETSLSEEPPPRRVPALSPRRVAEVLGAALAGALCVLLGVVAVAVPTLLAWLADERSSAGLWQTLGVSVDLWAMAHRAQVDTPAASVVLAPLLLTAVPFGLCWYAVRQIVLARPHLLTRGATVGGWRPAWHALGGTDVTAFALGYLVTGLGVTYVAGFGIAQVALPSLVPGALLLPAAAVALVWWAEHRREQHPSVDAALTWVRDRIPVLLRRALAPAAEALVALAAVCFLLVLGLLLVRGERILTLYAALDAGLVGTLTLTLAQLAALPNLMLWALGWMTGAGVTVGTVHVDWVATTPGDLPLVPVLGALPEPGALPAGLWAMALVPLVAGGWIGYRCAGAASRLTSWWTKAQITLASCAAVSLAVLVLGWLSSGGLTPGLLGTVGVVPWELAGLLLLELAVGGLLVLTVQHLRARRI
jgi:hypothetical protein